jgi:P27 family predicted phage terminase small subunit
MRKKIEWKHIQSEYEDSFKSVRSIAKENNVSHSAIQQKAKKEGWKKLDEDLIKDKYLVSNASFLDTISIRKIKEIMTELGDKYSSLDEALIIAYAVNYSNWIELQNKLKIEGVVIESSKGGKYLNPTFNATKSVEKTILSIANQLGLTLASRKKLDINIDANDKNIDSIFNIIVNTENSKCIEI